MFGRSAQRRTPVEDAFPVLDGALPLVGHLPEMYRGFPALCARGVAAHGPLFWIHGGPGARQLMCTDARALPVLRNPSVSTSFYAEGFPALLANTLFAFDGDEHRRVRSVLAPAFTPGRVRRSDVMHIVDDCVQRAVESWIEAGGVSVLAATREVALKIIFRIIGVPVADVSEWSRQYSRYLLAGLPSRGRWRGPIHWLAARARTWLDERLGAIVDGLRAKGDESTLVGAIANSRDEHGRWLERGLVVANLRLLVFAGHETTASAMAWTILHLAAAPEEQRRAMAEAEAVDDLVAFAGNTEHFTYAEARFREALRMYPAVHSVIRRVATSIDLEAGRIATGTLLNVPFVHLLRDEANFEAPSQWRPDRWKERPRPGTVETAMFGGGPHFCLGYHIAIAEGTLFGLGLARAMARHHVHLRAGWKGQLPAPIYLPLSHPPRGLAVRFAR